MNTMKLEKSSGNVFADIGVSNPELAHFKAELAYEISNRIKELGLTQKEAGERLGIDQAKVSAISCGRLKGFSLERLIRYLSLLDIEVNFTVSPKKLGKTHSTRTFQRAHR